MQEKEETNSFLFLPVPRSDSIPCPLICSIKKRKDKKEGDASHYYHYTTSQQHTLLYPFDTPKPIVLHYTFDIHKTEKSVTCPGP